MIMIKTTLKYLSFSIAWIVAMFLFLLLSLFVPVEAADNDDLAFEFISSSEDALVTVDECFISGYYTFDQAEKDKYLSVVLIYSSLTINNIGDFCQQVHEDLYPREYSANKTIRGLVK